MFDASVSDIISKKKKKSNLFGILRPRVVSEITMLLATVTTNGFEFRENPGSISTLLFLKFPTNKCSLLGQKSNAAKSQFLKI